MDQVTGHKTSQKIIVRGCAEVRPADVERTLTYLFYHFHVKVAFGCYSQTSYSQTQGSSRLKKKSVWFGVNVQK